MASNGNSPPTTPQPQLIPLQDLSRPPDRLSNTRLSPEEREPASRTSRFSDRRSILGHKKSGSRYERLAEGSPSRAGESSTLRLDVPTVRTQDEGLSPLDDLHGFAAATSSVGLMFDSPRLSLFPQTPQRSISNRPIIITSSANGQDHQVDTPEHETVFTPDDNDTTPLTDRQFLRPSLSHSNTTGRGQRLDRSSNRTSVHWVDGESPRQRDRAGSRLGDDLPKLDTGLRPGRTLSRGSRLTSASGGPSDRSASRSVSPTPSPISRAQSILREVSQRVVNLSNDSDMVEQGIRRKSSIRRPSFTSQRPAFSDVERPETPKEEDEDVEDPHEKEPATLQIRRDPAPIHPPPNPLRGNSFGFFGPDNKLRMKLCNWLVHPATEPVIMVLIVIQAVLLAVDSAPSVYNDPRTKHFGSSRIDYAILGLFVVYTFEMAARIIVSGFISNPVEYSTIDRRLGLKNALLAKGQSFFSLQREEPARRPSVDDGLVQPSIVRTFTGLPDPDQPGHSRQQQRMRLARRAFLRHSFNRLDFVAVVAFWISFGMEITGYESTRHVYVFKMLSCLRILRLLLLTSGTSIILRSLKKAAPLLVHVAFLISFFWLLFGIVGVQTFKSSLRRTCVWVNPDGSGNYTQNLAPENVQFCGGHLDNSTGLPMPWLTPDGQNGTVSHKGFLCPQGSFCVEGVNPYNGTVSFDNIFQSLELVFVIMSSNTFTDLLYYLTDTDYLAAALFFAAGIVVMSFWLANLLVAVITSSFQVIREESNRSAFTTVEKAEPQVEEEVIRRPSTIHKVYEKTYFVWIMVIIFGLVVQCFRSANSSQKTLTFIMDSETCVTFILVFEIIFRFASDWRHFFGSRRNWFDLGLAVMTAITQIPPIRNSGQPYAWLSFFQILRIYRAVMAFSVTRDLVMVVFGGFLGLLNLFIFVFLLTFLCAILASQLFRGDFPTGDAAGNTIHVTFFDIYNSFIGMYQVLSSENWTIIMYNATQFDDHWDTAWLASLFFIMWFVLANFIVLNMFIAVIQESFDVSEDEKRLQQVKAFLQQKEQSGSSQGNLSLSSIFRMGRESLRHRDALEYGPAAMEQLLKEAVVKEFLDEDEEPTHRRPVSVPITKYPVASSKPGFLTTLWGKVTGLNESREPNPFYSTSSFSRAQEEMDPRTLAKNIVAAAEHRRRAQRQYLTRHPKYNVSLFVFGPNSGIRRFCQSLVGPGRGERIEGAPPWKPVWYAFTAFIYAAIVAMVLLACVTTPLYQREYYQTHSLSIRNWFVWTDMGFAGLFTIEALIKVIADGFFFTPNAYFRSTWGLIDGVVLITLWINVITSLYRDNDVSRAVGAFKALRALRLLNVSDSARNTFHAVIIVGGWKVISAAFVSLSLLVPFAILGLNLFNGQMELCNDNQFPYEDLSNCVGEYQSSPFNWSVLAPRQVANPYYSFDDFGSSLFILFQIVSQEGWTDVMWSAMSMMGVGVQPRPFASQENAVFFIIFNLLGTVFVLTLFVSVFMRNYTEQTGVAFLTADQRSWLELRKLLKQISPTKKSLGLEGGEWRKFLHRLSSSKHGNWQRFITTLMVLHLTLLVIEFYPSVPWWEVVREFLFLILTCFYSFNILIRILGFGWERFRRSAWDVYSVFAVGGTLVTTILVLAERSNPTFDQIHKLFLVSIAFLLIPRNNQLDQLFKTAAASLTAIGNLMATWFVLFLVYAIAFTQTLGLTRFGPNEWGNLNFRNVPKALILLFRMSCGEGWNQIMEDYATIVPPICVREDNFFDSDCGSAGWARALFISWNIISMYIFVSLFVSLIFESFSYVYQRTSGLSVISREEIRRFKHAWAEYDPKGTGYISKEKFPRLLGELSGVFQMRIYEGDFTVSNILEDCRLELGSSSENRRVVAGICLDTLNERLNRIPVDEIRRRRTRMNVFYEEMLVSADPDRGISFTVCLMALAHYNVINDTKSLRLEEFLRRRAKLQRVQESIRRNIVIGFFDMMYWSRKFRRTIEGRRSYSRLGEPPQLPVPEIFIENPDDTLDSAAGTEPRDFTESAPLSRSIFSDREPKPSSWNSRGLPPLDTTPRNRNSLKEIQSPGSERSIPASPGLSPHRLHQSDTAYGGAGSASPKSGSPSHSRQASAVSAQGVMESFGNSAWGESIRRSFTMKRPRRSTDHDR